VAATACDSILVYENFSQLFCRNTTEGAAASMFAAVQNVFGDEIIQKKKSPIV